jgi:hypothetical protein
MKRLLKWLLAGLAALFLVAAAGAAYYFATRPALPPPPTPAELEALRQKRDALQERVLDLTVRKDDQGLAKAPRASIMIGVPTRFTRSIVEQVVTGLFRETTLTLRNLKVHKAGAVRVKAVVAKRKVGEYVLDVHIHEVKGLLRPGEPVLRFGTNRVGLELPVKLAEGSGNASVRLSWDSKGLVANTVCGDVDVTKEVSGTVVPAEYMVQGGFAILSSGDAVLLKPQFPELAVKINVQADPASWKRVDEVIAAQNATCRTALEKADIKKILGGILGKGFNVKIPQKIFKPIRLPAGVSSSLRLQGVDLALQVKATGLVVTDDRVWYGANVKAGTTLLSPPAPAGAAAGRGGKGTASRTGKGAASGAGASARAKDGPG